VENINDTVRKRKYKDGVTLHQIIKQQLKEHEEQRNDNTMQIMQRMTTRDE